MRAAPLGWFGIARLGLVQASLGAIVVMTTTVLNRVMVVELALPAVLPGGLVAFHYAVQMLRPRWGHGSDGTGRRTPWILGGMATLALGGTGAAAAVALMRVSPVAGIALAILCYVAIGLGVGAAGTALLTLAATAVAPERRAASAAVIWITMIAGFAVTTGIAGSFLDPFTLDRLLAVVASVCGISFGIAALAMIGVEGLHPPRRETRPLGPPAFGRALREVWAEAPVRRFAVFVFTSMLAYGSQDLVLDPFAGRVLGLTPGETTHLSGLQHGGALLGMLAVAIAGGLWGRRRPGFLTGCTVAGCMVSATMLAGLAIAGAAGPAWPLRASVAVLGFGNGVFAVSAIGAMMVLAGQGGPVRSGLRMGLWGAAQAIAFGLGALCAPVLVELATRVFASPVPAYAGVFLAEAILFLLSARLVASGAPSCVPGDREPAALLAVSS